VSYESKKIERIQVILSKTSCIHKVMLTQQVYVVKNYLIFRMHK